MVDGEEGRVAGGGWFGEGTAAGSCRDCDGDPAACVKILRRGKTGGVFDFCDCDCGESRRVANGGVGTLGGVTDRLVVAVAVEARGVEVRSGTSVRAFFRGARLLTRPFRGGKGEAEPADSISIVASGEVGMFVFTVTIDGTEPV